MCLRSASDGQSLAIATPGLPELIQLADGSFRTLGPFADGIELLDLDTHDKRRIEIHRDWSRPWRFHQTASLSPWQAAGPNPVIRLYRTADGREMGSFSCPARVTIAGRPRVLSGRPEPGRGTRRYDGLIWDIRDVR